jgi:hypothetical protein
MGHRQVYHSGSASVWAEAVMVSSVLLSRPVHMARIARRSILHSPKILYALLHKWAIGKYITLDQCSCVPRQLWHHPYNCSNPSRCPELVAEVDQPHSRYYVHFYINGTFTRISHWIGICVRQGCYGIVHTIMAACPHAQNSWPKHITLTQDIMYTST